MKEISVLESRIKNVMNTVAETAAVSGRNPEAVKIVAVSKTKPVEDMRHVYNCGLSIFGESKVQEAEEKIAACLDVVMEWHLIGHLQTNKVKKAVQYFDLIHSVDSIKLIEKIDTEAEKVGKTQRILLQINVSGEESKFGCRIDGLDELIARAENAKNVRCEGFMTIPPRVDNIEQARPYFRRLKEVADQYKNAGRFKENRIELSMGMTNDYPIAVQEGATFVRIGTAIFGERHYT